MLKACCVSFGWDINKMLCSAMSLFVEGESERCKDEWDCITGQILEEEKSGIKE